MTPVTRLSALSWRPSAALALAGWIAAATPTLAGYTIDRWYRFGDDAAERANGSIISGSTVVGSLNNFASSFDSVGQSGSFQDFDTIVGNPVYVDISASRPVAANSGNTYAARLDGDDYLRASFFNVPSESAAAGVEPYAGKNEGGYQFWFQADAAASAIRPQQVLDDGDEMGLRLNTGGSYQAQRSSGGTGANSNAQGPATLGVWTHAQMVRLDPAQNSRLVGTYTWIDGLARVAQATDFRSTSLDLVLGADVEPDTVNGGETYQAFFVGLVDELEMFVLDSNGAAGERFSYTRDNGYFTDVFLPSTPGYGFTAGGPRGHNAEAWITGDINYDGVFNQSDVNAFVSGWLSRKNVPDTGSLGDYETLALGDLDLDGDTDLSDWFVMRGLVNGTTLVLPTPASIPEPAAFALASILIGCTPKRRPRG